MLNKTKIYINLPYLSFALPVLPRQTVFYDIVDFLYCQTMSPMLQGALPTLLSRPLTQDIQLQHMKIISQVRYVDVENCFIFFGEGGGRNGGVEGITHTLIASFDARYTVATYENNFASQV